MIDKSQNCTKCKDELTSDNIYKYRGYIHKQCKKCRNSYGKELYRKRAKTKKDNSWF